MAARLRDDDLVESHEINVTPFIDVDTSKNLPHFPVM
jgi:hypothetical protein